MPGKKITAEQKRIALDSYRKHGNMTIAAKEAGVNRSTLWAESKRNVSFKRRLTEAKSSYCDMLEAVLDNKILNEKGMPGVTALIFKLKAEMPNKYRDRVSGSIDHNIKIISGIPRPEPKQIESGKRGRPKLLKNQRKVSIEELYNDGDVIELTPVST